ncbi:MAG: class I SAM-dependent methyltransferase [Chloroflexi bacterium]|nr:class I SAM-dependent methyltransferase [Chloroflexota bacterium]MBA3627839.1 class I SAM-dependent methyltransferase [Chloroflexota bacterium]MBA3795945.1 class I SAM-dependent methyltransferase [Chloroflexota bacterium]
MSGNERRPRARVAASSSWERVATWYDGWVGDKGSWYHRGLAVPAVLDLLHPVGGEEILDIGAGQGVLAEYIAAAGARYTGVDASPRLIEIARRRHRGRGRFLLGDARRLREVPALSAAKFDAGVFMLCLQDMDPLEPVLESVAWALRPTSRIVMLMTHPSFRQPRHSGWGFDASRKLRYRRVDAYLTPMAVPMGSAADGRRTRAYHRPISSYINALGSVGYAVDAMLELPDLPPERRPRRSGPSSRAGAGDEAEIPLFLAMRARRT